MVEIISIIMCFCIVLLPSIGSLYYSNILYYGLLAANGKVTIRNNNAFRMYIAFIVVYFLSIINYLVVLHGSYDQRLIIQFIFTIQYFVLLIGYRFDIEEFDHIFNIVCTIYSIVIIAAFFKHVNLGGLFFFVHQREWGQDIFNSWPNTTGLPIMFSLFLMMQKEKSFLTHWLSKVLMLVALFLITSRTTLLGAAIIIFYFLLAPRADSITQHFKKYFLAYIVVIAVIIYGVRFALSRTDLMTRLMYTKDRDEIFEIAMKVLSESPILGFGGVPLDVSSSMAGVSSYATHTHNFILELLVRYGILGLITFCGILFFLYKDLKSKDSRMMFLLMWFVALFQIYVRDFSFLFLVSYICYRDRVQYLKENDLASDEIYQSDVPQIRFRIKWKLK